MFSVANYQVAYGQSPDAGEKETVGGVVSCAWVALQQIRASAAQALSRRSLKKEGMSDGLEEIA